MNGPMKIDPPLEPLEAPPAGRALGAAPALLADSVHPQLRPEVWARLQRQPGVLRRDRPALMDSMRRLRSQVQLRLRAQGHSIVAVTSARSAPGKSLVALNLALALAAEHDAAALLLDADFSGCGLQRRLGLEREPGFVEHLTQALPLEGLLVDPGVPRLRFLPAQGGAQPPEADLLGSRAALQAMAEMRATHAGATVVVDLPPLLDLADAVAFLPAVDTTLLVVEDGGTTAADLEQVGELLAPFEVAGSVLVPRERVPRRRWWTGWWPLARRRDAPEGGVRGPGS
jgi:Mrp family chromosome partitioning ATPase